MIKIDNTQIRTRRFPLNGNTSQDVIKWVDEFKAEFGVEKCTLEFDIDGGYFPKAQVVIVAEIPKSERDFKKQISEAITETAHDLADYLKEMEKWNTEENDDGD